MDDPFQTNRMPSSLEKDHAQVLGMRVASIYLPNGNPQPGPKFDYKLAWMRRLRARAAELRAEEVPAVLAGDYNVIPHGDDVWDVRAMAMDALMQPGARDAWFRLLGDGWTDALRSRFPAGRIWTYWDYQAGAWQRDHGFRIDHLLLPGSTATTARATRRATTPRRGLNCAVKASFGKSGIFCRRCRRPPRRPISWRRSMPVPSQNRRASRHIW